MKSWNATKLLALLGAFATILQSLQYVVFAGPVRRSSRMIREVYPEIESEKLEGNQAEVCIVGDVVYGAEEPVPADQPCLKCKCEPPGVQCETSKCVKKPGCRAIHKPNECCPEYQCECEHEGRVYANGERLDTPQGGECRVCYCRGGEVQCAEVSCYIRTDCEGRTVPGQCCPKYDHCPPKEPLTDRVVPYTTQSVLTSNLDYWSPSNSSTEDQTTTALYDFQRITNEIIEAPTQSPEIHNTLEDINTLPNHEIKLFDETQIDLLTGNKNNIPEVQDIPKITIQEIIPEIKEIPITGSPKREINAHPHDQFIKDENKYPKEDLEIGDTESDSSEISEIYHHPPPVLKIGDQLLVLKKGELVPGKDISTPLPVITIIGAEGLQRGTEESGETHDIVPQLQEPRKETDASEEPRSIDNVTTESRIISFVKKSDDTTKTALSTIQDFLLNISKAHENDDDLENVDLNTSVMTESIINKIKSLTNVESTTDVAHIAQKVFVTDIDYSNVTSTTEDQNFTTPTEQPSSTETVTQKHVKHHDEEASIDQNPEYPPIPDIMSSQNVDEQDSLAQETNKNETEERFRLPTPISKEPPPSEQTGTTEASVTEMDRSKETVEESVSEESGEYTTPPNSHVSAMLSVEDASVETTQKLDTTSFVEMLPGVQFSTEQTIKKDAPKEDGTVLRKDVELINTQSLIDDVKPKENATIKDNRKKPASRFKNNLHDKDSEIFKQLHVELQTVPSRIDYSKTGNEEAEAEAIFRELLEDATSSSAPDSNTKEGFPQGQKESALLQRVSEAITKFQGKESKETLDSSILGILRDFFSSQYKYYETN